MLSLWRVERTVEEGAGEENATGQASSPGHTFLPYLDTHRNVLY